MGEEGGEEDGEGGYKVSYDENRRTLHLLHTGMALRVGRRVKKEKKRRRGRRRRGRRRRRRREGLKALMLKTEGTFFFCKQHMRRAPRCEYRECRGDSVGEGGERGQV